MGQTEPLLKLDGVTKVFLTDEVETHALSGIHMEIAKGEYVSIAGPSGCGKSTLLSILGLLDSPSAGQYLLNGRPVAELAGVGARARPQPRDRVHLPELQPDWRSHGVRERGAAAHLSRDEGRRAQAARRGRARARRHGAPREAPAQPALGRSAAARRRGARRRRRAAHPARRRADGQPRLEERRSGHGPAPRAAQTPARRSAW